jgi:hypothetical protein
MDKLAFCEMHGRELGLRLFLESEVEGIQKAASTNRNLNGDYVEAIDAHLDEIAYRDEQQKLAHNNGAYGILAEMAAALEEGEFDREALLGEVKQAMVAIQDAAVIPANEEEDAAMFEAMVKGAATMIAFQTGQEIDDDVIEAAAELVASQLQASTEQ